jgi:hypothetical protein
VGLHAVLRDCAARLFQRHLRETTLCICLQIKGNKTKDCFANNDRCFVYKVVRLKRDTVEEVFMYLDSLKYATEESSSLFGTWSSLDREVLFPELPELPERKKDEEQDADAPREVCCPFHFMPKRFVEEFGDDVDDVWDPTRNNEAIRVLNGCNRFLKQLLFSAPVTIMGSEIKLSKESFVVRGNHVHVLANEKMSPVNFASCWNGVDLHHVVDSDRQRRKWFFIFIFSFLSFVAPSLFVLSFLSFLRSCFISTATVF